MSIGAYLMLTACAGVLGCIIVGFVMRWWER